MYLSFVSCDQRFFNTSFKLLTSGGESFVAGNRATKDENPYTLVRLVLLLAMVLKTSALNSDPHELELAFANGRSPQVHARAKPSEFTVLCTRSVAPL